MKVILDTNFLIYCAKEKLDYKEEIGKIINEGFELVVPEQVVGELKRLAVKAKKGKDKDACDLALKLLDNNVVRVVKPVGKTVDNAIVNLAGEDSKNIVCTLDREMRHELGRVMLVNRGKKLMLTR